MDAINRLSNRFPYTCSRCNAPGTTARLLKRCGGCQLVAYCSKDCQKDNRRIHKPLCKEFSVNNGINVLHTTGPWEEHLTYLRRRAAPLPNENNIVTRIFLDPKVCYTCHESRPSLLTICKCSYVCYCSKKCAKADKWHKEDCSTLTLLAAGMFLDTMRASYPMTLLCALEEAYTEYQRRDDDRFTEDLVNLRVHVVTNRSYFDAKSWLSLFHQDILLNLKQLELIFIMQGMEFDSSFNHKGKFNQSDCEICQLPNKKTVDHNISFSVHQKPYHMFFSSSEYSEPDVVIVYGVTDICRDVHSEISYRNMTYRQDSLLVLTDSSYDLVVQGSQGAFAARPMDVLVKPIRNQFRFFGSNKSHLEFDVDATNEKYYLTCLRGK